LKEKYRVVVVGMGKRGMHHATAFQANPRFEVAGICDIDETRLNDAGAKLGVAVRGTDAAKVAQTVRPDIFCFCNAAQYSRFDGSHRHRERRATDCHGKPVALTSAEGFEIRDLIGKSGIKAVVSHQHRYGAHYQKSEN